MNEKLELLIRQNYADLRKSEKKTADYLMNYTGSYRELTLEKIAEAAKVSQPSVLRFIKALGYKGFKEFRYELAEKQEREPGEQILYGFSFNKGDRIEDVPSKIIGTSIDQLKETLKNISPGVLEQVVDSLVHAERIAVYYVENSSCTAGDLVTKLLYLGLNCMAYSDQYMQKVSAGNLTDRDVAVGISYTGYSKNTVDAMHMASKRGARTIAITNFENSLISKYADLLLCTSNRQYLYGDAIFSRLSQMAVVDMIYTGILVSNFKRYTGILDRNSQMIRNQSYLT